MLLASLVAVALPIRLQTSILLVTGCFTLVYVLGTAAAVRLLAGPARVVAGLAFAAVLGLLCLTGPPALLSLAVAAGAVAYQAWRSRRARPSPTSQRPPSRRPPSRRPPSQRPPSRRPPCRSRTRNRPARRSRIHRHTLLWANRYALLRAIHFGLRLTTSRPAAAPTGSARRSAMPILSVSLL